MDLKDFDPAIANWKLHWSVNLLSIVDAMENNRGAICVCDSVPNDAVEIYCCLEIFSAHNGASFASVSGPTKDPATHQIPQWAYKSFSVLNKWYSSSLFYINFYFRCLFLAIVRLGHERHNGWKLFPYQQKKENISENGLDLIYFRLLLRHEVLSNYVSNAKHN